jgi:hypothetical protein
VLPHIFTISTNKTEWPVSQFTAGMGAVWAPEPVWIKAEDKNLCLYQETNPNVLHIKVTTQMEPSWLVK